MSTLTKESSSPVKVAQVFADFRLGLPRMGTVFVSARRHRVQVSWTAKGLRGMCKKCTRQDGCAAVFDAIRAVEILAEAWERPPISRIQARVEADIQSDPLTEPEQPRIRPYDGLARDICQADLVPIHIPPWAYDEQGTRRPVVDAEIAEDVWYELQHRLNRLLGYRIHAETSYRPPVHKYYQASWELDRGMTHAAFKLDLLTDLDEDGQLDAFAP
ncbi:MAG: hypothetical protein AUH31_09240 [Armatimonadetes bacterium 13_1_40CM_64_14]|nr:MAG: hypothetical protein AUH31_09240 [Armatimonadetes bacterium 13_1_40CM_64_14]